MSTPTPVAASPDPVRAALERALGTRYSVGPLLGRGGMGAVYLAHESGLDREVAVKVLPPERAASAEARERFTREARTAARLTHPNVVPLHAFGEQDGMLFYVMGYVRGESLAARLRRRGRLPEEEARRVIAAVADALAHAHQQGVVHRDVKPDNILLEDGTGRALLTDFGIARAEAAGAALTSTGMMVGTPGYMSPEQVRGSRGVDARSDLYSLGVTLYACLAGKPPFDGGTPADVMLQHVSRTPPPLAAAAPGVSDALAAVVMRCLAKDPAERWPDAAGLAAALRTREGEQDVPEPLRPLEYGGHLLLGLGLAAAMIWLATWKAPQASVWLLAMRRVLGGVAGLLALVLAGALLRARHAGFPSRSCLAMLFREPGWWPLWYPPALRRSGSLWDRLPRPARRLRAAMAALVVGLLVPVQAVLWQTQHEDVPGARSRLALQRAWAAVYVGLGALVLLSAVHASQRLRRQGLTSSEADRLLMSEPPVAGPFWERPHVRALLRPAAPGAAAGGSVTAALEEHASALDPPLRERVLGAGRRLSARVRELEERAAGLASEAEDADVAELAGKLDKLGAPVPGEPAPRSRLRELLATQLEVARDLEQQREQARAERARAEQELARLLPLVERVRHAGAPERRAAVTALEDALGGAAVYETLTTGALEAETLPRV